MDKIKQFIGYLVTMWFTYFNYVDSVANDLCNFICSSEKSTVAIAGGRFVLSVQKIIKYSLHILVLLILYKIIF